MKISTSLPLSRLFLLASVATLATWMAPWSAPAQNIAFDAASIWAPNYHGLTGNTIPNNPNGDIVIYGTPATGRYALPVDSFFDVFSKVQNGPINAAGFGGIVTVAGTGQVVFNPPPIAAGDDPPSNLNGTSAIAGNTQHLQITGFDALYGATDVPGLLLGNRSLGLTGVHLTNNADIPITNDGGLATIPYRVSAGVGALGTETFALSFGQDADFTGFINTAQVLLSNAAFPHGSRNIVVRQSRPGDMDGNGLVNGFDIDGYVKVISNSTQYQNDHPWLQSLYIADFDSTGAVNGFDIAGFVAAIAMGSPSAPVVIPEPTALALLGMGLVSLAAGVLIRRRRRGSVAA